MSDYELMMGLLNGDSEIINMLDTNKKRAQAKELAFAAKKLDEDTKRWAVLSTEKEINDRAQLALNQGLSL